MEKKDQPTLPGYSYEGKSAGGIDSATLDTPFKYQNTGRHSENDEISLKQLVLTLQEWFRFLLSKWLIILSACVLGAILGLVYARSKKPLYIAELTFVLEDKNQSPLGSYGGLISQFGGNTGGGGVFGSGNLLALMKSRTMIEKTLLTSVEVNGEKKTLAEFYIDVNRLREKWSKEKSHLAEIRFLPNSNPATFTLDHNQLISGFHGSLINENLFVGNKDKESNILSISVTSENELFSKFFTEILAQEVSDFYIETKTRKSAYNLSLLQHQTDSVRNKLYSTFTGVAVSTDAHPNLNPSRRVLLVPSQQKQVDIQTNQAMLTELVKNLEATRMSLREDMPLIQIVDRPVFPLPVSRVSPLRMMIVGSVLMGMVVSGLLISRRLIRVYFKN